MIHLRDYQQDARKNMDMLAETGDFKTLLAVATGGGKTLMAEEFIIATMLAKGYQCVWFAPSRYLLRQAVVQAKKIDSSIKVCVPKMGKGFRRCTKDYDFMMMTYQYATRHMEELRQFTEGKKIIMVIDEAHHSVANSFQDLISLVEGAASNYSLLGLTATPIRTDEDENKMLGSIFTVGVRDGVVSYDTGIVYQIGLLELINRGYLAKPIKHSIKTTGCKWKCSLDDEDFDKGLVDNMQYNALVVDTYIENRELYGKTIVFAYNKAHAILLYEILLSKGVSCGLAISGKVKGRRISAKEDIDAYREGKIEVLVTCKMLNEGFDVPDTKSVFLAKPMRSVIECTQAVGRALRKKEVDNTAHIVTFDNVSTPDVLWFISDIATDGASEVEQLAKSDGANTSIISYEAIVEYLKLYNKISFEFDSVEDECDMPCGFCFYKDADGDVQQIIVYNSNSEVFENFLKDIASFDEDAVMDIVMQLNVNSHTLPISAKEIVGLINYYRASSEIPKFYCLNEATNNILAIGRYVDAVVELSTKDMKMYLNEVWEKNIILKYYYRTVGDFYKEVISKS